MTICIQNNNLCVASASIDNNGLIYNVIVDKNFRGKGLGNKLLETLLSDRKHAYLFVDKENTIALSLYKKFGFKISKSFNSKTFYYMKWTR